MSLKPLDPTGQEELCPSRAVPRSAGWKYCARQVQAGRALPARTTGGGRGHWMETAQEADPDPRPLEVKSPIAAWSGVGRLPREFCPGELL